MKGHKLATRLHRWLAAIIGIQILIWFASGAVMAILPINKVRGEHLLTQSAPTVLPGAGTMPDITKVWRQLPRAPERVDIFMLSGKPVLRADFGAAAAPVLFDIASTRQISPLPREIALALVRAQSTKPLPHATAQWVTEKSTEYRGDVPVWRVDGNDDEAARFFVDQASGQIKPVRTGLWRAYDFIWGLHIMDWSNHENFNTPWLIGSAIAAFVVACAGVWLFVYRVVAPWRRRRKLRSS